MGNTKTCNLSFDFAANRVELRWCAFYHPRKKTCNLLCCKTNSNVGGEMRNIAIQLAVQQCCKTGCTFFAAGFTVSL